MWTPRINYDLNELNDLLSIALRLLAQARELQRFT